jgi:hypothetical protein
MRTGCGGRREREKGGFGGSVWRERGRGEGRFRNWGEDEEDKGSSTKQGIEAVGVFFNNRINVS